MGMWYLRQGSSGRKFRPSEPTTIMLANWHQHGTSLKIYDLHAPAALRTDRFPVVGIIVLIDPDRVTIK